MLESIVLGFVQGITEWIPISSEGAVTAVASIFFNRSLSEAVLFALWLHLGTALAALLVLRRTVAALVREVMDNPLRPSPLMSWLAVSTVVSGVIGLPLLLLLSEVSAAIGTLAMAVVGVFMLVTGAVQIRQPRGGFRDRRSVGVTDALVVGVAQGLAALPGLSRSGLTVSVLLARGIDRQEALVLSFLMSIPAAAGAAVYAAVKEGLLLSTSAALAALVAFVVGLATIRALLSAAGRINFGAFVVVTGAALILAAAVQVAFF